MSLAVPLLVFKDQYIALARATGRIRSVLAAVATAAALEVLATLLGSRLHGLDGALIAWIAVLAVEAAYSLRGLRIIRREEQAAGVPAADATHDDAVHDDAAPDDATHDDATHDGAADDRPAGGDPAGDRAPQQDDRRRV
jgi:hypothetical protein